jgi:ribosomal protein S27E
MAYVFATSCEDCKADFGELVDNDSHVEIWPCQSCRELVSAQRNPFRFDLRRCPICTAEFQFVYPRRRTDVRCPKCGSSRIKYVNTMHLLMVNDFGWPNVGDIVQGTFVSGAFGTVNVPDMVAIPIHQVTELPLEFEGQICELRVTSVPADKRNDRDYNFAFLCIATPMNAYKPMG